MNPITAPTRTVSLPMTKVVVEFKEWLTKQEAERIREPVTNRDIEFNSQGDITKQSLSPSIMTEMEHRTIEAAVVSLTVETGEKVTDGLLGFLLALPESDWDYMKVEIDKVLNPPKGEKAP